MNQDSLASTFEMTSFDAAEPGDLLLIGDGARGSFYGLKVFCGNTQAIIALSPMRAAAVSAPVMVPADAVSARPCCRFPGFGLALNVDHRSVLDLDLVPKPAAGWVFYMPAEERYILAAALSAESDECVYADLNSGITYAEAPANCIAIPHWQLRNHASTLLVSCDARIPVTGIATKQQRPASVKVVPH